MAPECGIRETVTIQGEATITHEDYVSGRLWQDAVCYSFYPIDLHYARGGGIDTRPLQPGTVPTVPRGALVPRGSRRLLAAGRCLSSDREANSALRVQATCMACGQAAAVLAAQAMGADFAYIGSAFIATEEARASDAYKQAIVDSNSDDIVYSNLFTGVHGNYLAPSIRNAGMDPDNLPVSDPSKMNFGGDKSKAWKDIWGCGQGIGTVNKVQSTADFVAQLKREYQVARERLLSPVAG